MKPSSRNQIRREYSQNLQHHLWDRESGLNRRIFNGAISQFNQLYENNLIKCVFPNLSIQNVRVPPGYIRKFTPDGRCLLMLSLDQRSLDIYEYLGVSKIANLLYEYNSDVILHNVNSGRGNEIRNLIFDCIFKLRRNITLISDAYNLRTHLNREFSIFLENGRYVLLGAMTTPNAEVAVPIEYYHDYPDIFDDCVISDYKLFVVDLENLIVTDLYTYRRDCIQLAHNHGISAYGQTIAVCSKLRQCIDILECIDGKLSRVHIIGKFEEGPEMQIPTDYAVSGLECNMLSEFKQRLLTSFYKFILTVATTKERRERLKKLYRNFGIIESLIFTKAQLIDRDTLLIRFEIRQPEATASDMTGQLSEEKLKNCICYMFYSISKRAIIKVCDSNSPILLAGLRDYFDNFRNVRSLQTKRAPSSPSNNIYVRAAFDNNICAAGGLSKAALQMNYTLPISCQSYTTTPYLDCNLFKYNDRSISSWERPHLYYGTDVISFRDRNTNILKFRINLGNYENDECGPSRDMVAFIFHPYEPFVISIQKIRIGYAVNFHCHNISSIVDT